MGTFKYEFIIVFFVAGTASEVQDSRNIFQDISLLPDGHLVNVSRTLIPNLGIEGMQIYRDLFS